MVMSSTHGMEGDDSMADNPMVTLLDPTAEDVPEEHPIAPRIGSLSGTTVALLDNTKHNSDRFLAGIADGLVQQYGVARVVHRQKANANSPAPADLLDDVASADVVVHAVAD